MSHEGNDKVIDRERDQLPYKMKYLEKYGAYFEIVDGKLYDAPAIRDVAGAKSEPGVWDRMRAPDLDNYGEVTAPQVMGETKAQEFISDINKIFGSDFKLNQFDGR